MSAKLTIHKDKFIENVHHVKKDYPVMAVVKNNAYNTGLSFAINAFLKADITHFATTSLEDAIEIRKLSTDAVIFLMNPSTEFDLLRAFQIQMTLPSYAFYEKYQHELHDIKVHLEYENLLSRSGFKNKDEFHQFITKYEQDYKTNKMKVVGAWTHFGYADEFAVPEYEIERHHWLEILAFLKTHFTFEMIHAQNSASFVREEGLLEGHTHLRLGIILYGARPYGGLTESLTQQTIEVTSHVLQIRTLNPNQSAGYSFAYTSSTHERLAVVAIGYGDGVLRTRAQYDCLINGKRYPIKALMMSHMFVLVDDAVKANDIVTLYSNEIRIDEFTFKGVGANSEQLSALNQYSLIREVIE